MSVNPAGDETRILRLLHRGLLLEYFSLSWMTVEAVVSIGAGIFAGSLALVAFGGDSIIELLSAYAVAMYLRSPQAGEAEGERTEKVATTLLFALIPIIVLGSAYSYFEGIRAEGSPLGIAIAIGAVVVMPYLWIEKARIGRAADCRPLSIDAAESATCLFMAVTLLGGLLVEFFLKIAWVDYVATGIIILFVAKEAVESYRDWRRGLSITRHATPLQITRRCNPPERVKSLSRGSEVDRSPGATLVEAHEEFAQHIEASHGRMRSLSILTVILGGFLTLSYALQIVYHSRPERE
ncbi:MAG: cation transporter [Thaumarchaeota archaeon]|nr:cation transporter [Nitrososphaerota archaeon]